ncbi:heavy-metal resistance [Methylobacterium sp. WCS2018Hpa-22]|uniref:heavy-metal resistance n=1 Tax=Methylobacterium sp. WCS2018Hpa-22 TaxID=3073633 RepID=UPI00288AE779|nr:heavy-metal resistance [Methylobacterium sp. WCS2018Hpa-22]
MSSPVEKTNPFDPGGIVASMEEWCCLLKAAQELRNVDEEMMETMLEDGAPCPEPFGPDGMTKLRNIADLMRALSLDPEAIRQRQPEAMHALEAACLDCTERSRCKRELATGSAAGTYRQFCPNVSHLDRLHHA